MAYSEKTKQKALDLLAGGKSFDEVAKRCSVSPGTLFRWKRVKDAKVFEVSATDKSLLAQHLEEHRKQAAYGNVVDRNGKPVEFGGDDVVADGGLLRNKTLEVGGKLEPTESEIIQYLQRRRDDFQRAIDAVKGNVEGTRTITEASR